MNAYFLKNVLYKTKKNLNSLQKLITYIKCLKKRFQQARSECSHQSIDETMIKFKGRNSINGESSSGNDAIQKQDTCMISTFILGKMSKK